MESTGNQEDQSKPAKGLFRRKRKCCKIWSAVKMMADTRDRWRHFTNVLVSNGTKGYTAAAAATTTTTTTTTT
jgi:hypothetical protein